MILPLCCIHQHVHTYREVVATPPPPRPLPHPQEKLAAKGGRKGGNYLRHGYIIFLNPALKPPRASWARQLGLPMQTVSLNRGVNCVFRQVLGEVVKMAQEKHQSDC